MAWPGSPTFVTTSVDAGADDPSVARAEIKKAMDDLGNVIGGRGQADGVASLDAGSMVPAAQLPITPIASGCFVDGTAHTTTWTVPAGVIRVKVTAVGGGGGGGYVTPGTGGDHGGGGGAGGVAVKYFDVVAGDDFSYTVGAKGTGHSSGSDGDGADGMPTTVTSPASATPSVYTISAGAGAGGQGPPNRFGGAGGAALSGGGADSSAQLLFGGAGISGATRGGAGGSNSMTGGAAGATGYGGGGGFGSGSGTPGFDGLDGMVMFEW